ncbi:7654_t:CDS:2, partial [Entrophospora sp. SA101]
YLKLCHRYKDLAKYPGPKVVLASNVSLETGFSREFLFEISKSDINALILTDRGPPNSLARKLYHEWDRKSQTSQGVVKPAAALDLTINLMINKKVPLEGAELLEYKAEQRKKQEREAAQAALIAKSLSIIEEDETDDEESEAGDTDMEELLAKQFDLYVRDATKYGGFFKQTQSYLMYPFVEKRKRYDDYEEQLLENLSYLNILEQELHRKSKEIENEERILKEREQELENRKQRLKSISSKSSSDSDLSKNTKNTSATNTILDNDSNDEIPLKDVEQHSLYNESSLYPDTAVQSILSQGLSSISSHHLQSSVDSASNSSTINDEIIRQQQQNQQHLLQRQILDLPDNSRFLSPNPSEDAWSEIGSIISEDVGSEMSSAVDIDMEEKNNKIVQENYNSIKLPLLLNVYQGLLSCSAPIFTLVEAIATSMLILEIRRYVKETLEDEDLIHNKIYFLIISIITNIISIYFLYYIYDGSGMDILSATLIGSVLTLAITISIVCLIFNKGSIVDISLLFAYTIYCIYMLSLNWKDDGTKLKGGYRTDSTMPIFEDLKPLPLLIYLDFDLMDFINLFYNLNFHILLKKFSELIFNFKYVSVIEKAFSLNMFVSLIYRTVIISKLLYSVQMQEKNDEFDIEEEHLGKRLYEIITSLSTSIIIAVYTHLLLCHYGYLE